MTGETYAGVISAELDAQPASAEPNTRIPRLFRVKFSPLARLHPNATYGGEQTDSGLGHNLRTREFPWRGLGKSWEREILSAGLITRTENRPHSLAGILLLPGSRASLARAEEIVSLLRTSYVREGWPLDEAFAERMLAFFRKYSQTMSGRQLLTFCTVTANRSIGFCGAILV